MQTMLKKLLCLLLLASFLPAARPAPGKADKSKPGEGGPAGAEEKADASEASRQNREAERVYQKANRALDKRQWRDAADLFNQVVQLGGSRADAALYWRAYAEQKQGNRAEALASLAELEKSFPQSRWRSDAKALEVEVRQATGQPASPESLPDEELKLLALSGLMQSNSDKALDILEKILNGPQPPKLKERALFVLGQSGSAKGREIIGRVAKGGSNPDLQKKALESLALFGGKESMPILGEVYASSTDPEIKRAILGFYMIGGNKQSLWDAAKNEKSAELRREAIGQLGVLGASQELLQLYDQENSADLKHKILDALFVSGNGGKLIELVRREKDPALRREAVEKLGLIGADQTGKVLKDLYQNESDKKVKEAVINAFFLQGNATELVAIAKKETDGALKRKAVEQLSIMGSKEGTDYFLELLNQ